MTNATTIRTATTGDLPELERLWRASLAEIPPPDHVEVDVQHELKEIEEIVRDAVALVAEDGCGAVVGFALARIAPAQPGSRAGVLTDLYVEPEARRAGVGQALVHEAAARLAQAGLDHVELEVDASNSIARAVYARWGFHEQRLTLVAPLEPLAERLDPGTQGPSFGAVFVQTDDHAPVERAAAAFAPRIGSHGLEVSPPANGWIAVRDSVTTRDPAALRRLARELSDRLGAVVVSLGIEAGAVVRLIALERGSILDEYLSVPEFHGPLPPGDVIALAANPTVLHRLTGADPARLRAVARTAASPADLPPPLELLVALAEALGLPLDR
jgi:ribosomal protein S18 acetylase RimI-like enzyme